MRITPHEARQQGYTVDDTCYPWLAYKGPRFAPTSYVRCLTDVEARLWSALKQCDGISMRDIRYYVNGCNKMIEDLR